VLGFKVLGVTACTGLGFMNEGEGLPGEDIGSAGCPEVPPRCAYHTIRRWPLSSKCQSGIACIFFGYIIHFI